MFSLKFTKFFDQLSQTKENLLIAIILSFSLQTLLISFIHLESYQTKYTHRHFQSPLKYLRCSFPAGIYLLKVNSKNTRTRCEIMSLLLTLNIFRTLFQCFYC